MRKLVLVLWVCLVLAGSTAFAAGPDRQGPNLLPILEPGSGWLPVADGVWQRKLSDTTVQTYATGREGLEWSLDKLRRELVGFVDLYLANPTEKRRELLDHHRLAITDLEAQIAALDAPGGKNAAAPRLESGAQALAACQRTFNYGADIVTGICAERATANASYSTTCPESCQVHSYAYASWGCDSVDENDDGQQCTKTGKNVSCSSQATNQSGGGAYCFYYAYARISCPALNNLLLTQTDSKGDCHCVIC